MDEAPGPANGNGGKRDSGMRIDFSLSVGYKRRRSSTGDRWMERGETLALVLIGAVVTIIILLVLVPRILSALGSS